MKNLTTKGVKVLKSLHLVFAILWMGGVVAIQVVMLIDAQSGDELLMKQTALRYLDDILVIPAAIVTLITAIVYGKKTNWGFFKHRWLVVKWIVSISLVIIGTFLLSPMVDENLLIVKDLKDAALTNSTIIFNHELGFAFGCLSAGSLIFLVVISVFKPWKPKKAKTIEQN